MIDYDKYEKQILEEEPYNWVKHFLVDLPKRFEFLIKWGILFFIIYAMTMAMADIIFKDASSFCVLLK